MSCLKCIIRRDKTHPLFSFFLHHSAFQWMIWAPQHELWSRLKFSEPFQIGSICFSTHYSFAFLPGTARMFARHLIASKTAGGVVLPSSFFLSAFPCSWLFQRDCVFVVSEIHYEWLSVYIIIIPENTMAHQLRHRQNAWTPQFYIMASLYPQFHALKCAANIELHPFHWKAVMLNSSFTIGFIGDWKMVCVGDCFSVSNM